MSDFDTKAANGPESLNTLHEALTAKSASMFPYTARVDAGLNLVKAEVMETCADPDIIGVTATVALATRPSAGTADTATRKLYMKPTVIVLAGKVTTAVLGKTNPQSVP